MKEKIKKRIEELEQAKFQFIANVNACDGAISELKLLLEETKIDSTVETNKIND